MSMTKTAVLFILVEAPPFDQLKIKILFKYLNQGSPLWRYSRVLHFSAGQTQLALLALLHLASSEATSEALLDLVYLLQLTLDTMLLTLGKLV